jgi:hypothetical protein
MSGGCGRMLEFLTRHRHFILILAALAGFFFWLGTHAPQGSAPGMCAVYG